MKSFAVFVAFSAAAFSGAAFSDATIVADPDIPTDEITVSATRSATPLSEAPATVTVMTGDDLERRVAHDIKDLVRYEPNVSVRNTSRRASAGSPRASFARAAALRRAPV